LSKGLINKADIYWFNWLAYPNQKIKPRGFWKAYFSRFQKLPFKWVNNWWYSKYGKWVNTYWTAHYYKSQTKKRNKKIIVLEDVYYFKFKNYKGKEYPEWKFKKE